MPKIVKLIFFIVALAIVVIGLSQFVPRDLMSPGGTEANEEPDQNEQLGENAEEPAVAPEEAPAKEITVEGDVIEEIFQDEGQEPTPEATRLPDSLEQVDRDLNGDHDQNNDSETPDSGPATYLDVEPVPIDRFNLLEDAVFSEKVFEYEDAMHGSFDDPIIEGREWAEWSTNFLNLISHIEAVQLRFEVKKNFKLKPGQASSFSIELGFDERAIIPEPRSDRTGGRKMYVATEKANFQIVAKHSKAKELSKSGGVRLLAGFAGRHVRYVLEGNESTSVVLLIPRAAIYGPRGVMICPRDYELRKVRSGVRVFEQTGYDLVDISFVVRAVAEGKVTTGFGPGFAETIIQTTPNIPVNSLAFDSSRSIFPFASVEILPAQTRQAPVMVARDEFTGGVQTRITLHNSLNHKAVTKARVRLTVRKVDLPASFGVNMRGKAFQVDSGQCYSLVKETLVSHTFSKEKLEFEDQGEDKSLEELAAEL